MKFKKRVKVDVGLRQIDIAPLIDCVFLLLIFFMLTSSFVVMPGINVKLPKTVTSEDLDVHTAAIVISSEDIVYLENKPCTIKELNEYLKNKKYESIFIKADKDASLGTVAGIWDVCKRVGIEKIGIATTHGD